jgi:hypothetical protein
MRYFKGIIALSPTQDLPLLRQVMYSKYVTQTQLWQFMRHSGYELSRGSFWWRVKRLVDHGFITGHSLPMVHRDPIFAIAYYQGKADELLRKARLGRGLTQVDVADERPSTDPRESFTVSLCRHGATS